MLLFDSIEDESWGLLRRHGLNLKHIYSAQFAMLRPRGLCSHTRLDYIIILQCLLFRFA